jgi:predicted dehydrogenase
MIRSALMNTPFTILTVLFAICHAAEGKTDDKKIGVIGLDTSHAIAFTNDINGTQEKPGIDGYRVVVAYPKGSPDIESSVSRVPEYTAKMEGMGVEIVPSIAALLEKVDYVLLETNDGRLHLEQVLPVLAAGKPVFIDKPLAGRLGDCLAIYAAAKKAKVPVFSSSSLRYGKNSQAVRGGSIGKVQHCETSSPCSLEKTHPDLYWYGIHGVESLYTVMGPGCETVQRRTEDGKIVVEGTWTGGRTGIYREGQGYSGSAQGTLGKSDVGSYDGYRPLVDKIIEFFRTGSAPVSAEETIEIYAFMEAADESKRQGGKAVSISQVLGKAQKKASE